MENIRVGIFETNSSSSHSISIDNSSKLLTSVIHLEDGEITLGLGDYDCEQERYTDAWTKADYCTITARDANEYDIKSTLDKKLIPRTRELNVDFVRNRLKAILIKVISEQLDIDKSLIKIVDQGYIDHQSSDTALDLFNDPEQLRRFIFSPKSVLVTDNDNH